MEQQQYSSKVNLYQKELDMRSWRNNGYRWVALALACMLMFGETYCFDNPMSLQTQIMENLDLDEFEFNLLYSVYSLPNIVIPFYGGQIIDKFGVRFAIQLFLAILLIGQTIFTVGGYMLKYWLMILGRIIFGMGSECLLASQQTIITQWFYDKEYSLAIGLCICIPRLGSSLNSFISPRLYEHYGNIGVTFLAGLFWLFVSLCCALALLWLDKEMTKRERLLGITQDADDINHGEEHINCNDLKNLKKTFWVLIAIGSLGDSLVIAFMDNANQFFQLRYGYTEEEAGSLLVIPYFMGTVCVVGLGLLGEKLFKRRSIWIIIATFFYLLTHVLLYVFTCDQSCAIAVLPVLLLGISFSLFSTVIQPGVKFVIDPTMIGTGFGLLAVAQNLALATFPMISGVIYNTNDDNSEGDNPKSASGKQSLFYISISCVAVVLSYYLYWIDKKSQGILLGREQIEQIDEEQSTGNSISDRRDPSFYNKNIHEKLINPASQNSNINL